ncbi:TetR/AcrR family transcriptional regulator [Saccharopolyspora taberi]|uniref:TetR/AcrR family transcriptional regulator n=1 Tax=Saccharopolyspora taberi TaxID=60895 RepID=A0ABN3VN00_9PSEU
METTGRSARKRESILDAARELFLRNGYLGTSMDEIAALAKVSKQTVYKHFGDKRRMFVELLTGDMDRADASVAELAEAVPVSQDLAADLRAFARAYLAAVMQPHLIRLRRVVIGEAERFPELAEAWYAGGPEQAYATFAEWFEVLGRRGLIRAEDPVVAAQHFNWLVLSVPINEAMARPDASFERDRLDRVADEAVRVFLAAYGTS